ncbi:DUF3857 domain-containing protein [Flavobacterium litorale]|uniref:DUF3857 domain-containing protein n=1 Tax=Flavobacterium litorale TaxID=2856519 RepID=A0ABX8V2T2_9FLAO|nr:DUF3857 domain-containing protein [Flavobacterium litorale]QYJ67155.1 DUF3857 domain-containing protein [Flavobacterium litorale]
MSTRLLTLLFVIISYTTVQAQQYEYELGEVTKEELSETSHPTDKDAPAAILFSDAETYMVYFNGDGFNLITEVSMKIKIYNKDGYNWANKTIPYYHHGQNKEKVDISKAYTYNLVNGKVKRTKLRSEGEFTEEPNPYWKLRKIVMPEVKEGSIVEYHYKITSPLIHSFPEWRFQESIPVNHSRYATKIPEYFVYTPNFRGYHTPKVTKESNTKTINFTNKQRNENQVTTFNNSKSNYQEIVTRYEFENLPAMKSEAFVNNIDNYRSSVEHEITVIKYPNQPIKSVAGTWEDVAKSIYDNSNFGTELKKTGYFEEDVDALLSGLSSHKQKMDALYFYVRDRMNWNDYNGYSCQEGVRKAYKSKVGNIADINLMLTSMLRYAGLDANPVLVTTRSNKIALFPNREAFNYVIVAVKINDETVLLDATSKSAAVNVLPFRAINWTGRLIKKDGKSESIALIPTKPSSESNTILATMDAQGKLEGQVKKQYRDYDAYSFRERYGNLTEKSTIERIEENYEGIAIEEYESKNVKNFTKPISEKYSFTHSGSNTDVIGDKIYISPMLFLTHSESPFKQEEREYPVDFIYPREDKYMISITIPEGYTVETVPTGVSIAMEQNIGTFSYNVIANGNKIMVRSVLQINYASIPKEFYPTLKDFFHKMIEKENEKIIIAKKS